jgi:hypothetical protein
MAKRHTHLHPTTSPVNTRNALTDSSLHSRVFEVVFGACLFLNFRYDTHYPTDTFSLRLRFESHQPNDAC